MQIHFDRGRFVDAPNGDHVLNDVEAGPAVVYVPAEGYGVGRAMVDVPSGDDVVSISMTVRPQAEGVVRAKGVPLPGARVRWRSLFDNENITSGPDGSFHVRVRAMGASELSVNQLQEGESRSLGVTVEAGLGGNGSSAIWSCFRERVRSRELLYAAFPARVIHG